MKDLIGTYSHKIDSKRRMFIPSDYRVSGKWVITAGLEKCLWLFPYQEWKEVKEKIKNFSLTKKDSRSFLRVFLSRAGRLTMDNQGRILIPDHLCSFAGIKKNCSLIGMIDRVEIWDRGRWEKYSGEGEKLYAETAEKIVDVDL